MTLGVSIKGPLVSRACMQGSDTHMLSDAVLGQGQPPGILRPATQSVLRGLARDADSQALPQTCCAGRWAMPQVVPVHPAALEGSPASTVPVHVFSHELLFLPCFGSDAGFGSEWSLLVPAHPRGPCVPCCAGTCAEARVEGTQRP